MEKKKKKFNVPEKERRTEQKARNLPRSSKSTSESLEVMYTTSVFAPLCKLVRTKGFVGIVIGVVTAAGAGEDKQKDEEAEEDEEDATISTSTSFLP